LKQGLADVVAQHHVLICAGSGGVGKTTTAAALGIYGAQQGRRTVVLTIDPARRLADALGLREIGNEPSEVGVQAPGTLSAMMLDQKGAWDHLVERYAPSEEVRNKILANSFYQHLSQSFAGSQEYMAVEQLAELHDSGSYDLIVVDTPPTSHALDFLESPQRISDFLSRDVVRWFVKPYFSAGWKTFQVVNRTVGSLARRLEEATGTEALAAISEFFTSMSGLFDGFEDRVQAVNELIRSPQTAFVLVVSPDEQVLAEAEYFFRKVGELAIRLCAVVFNRVHHESELGLGPSDEEWLRSLVEPVVGTKERVDALVSNFFRYETQACGDDLRIDAFRDQLPPGTVTVSVPNFDEDLHDLPGLHRMLPYLVGD